MPRTSEELKQVKKAARESSVEKVGRAFLLEVLRCKAWSVTETGMQRPNVQALMKNYNIRMRDTEPRTDDWTEGRRAKLAAGGDGE